MNEGAGTVEVRLARDLTFLQATMMGIGATVGAGIFVLLGYAAGAAGPAVLLAFLLNGLVAGLTAVTYADLGTTFPEAGGGYLWVREALPKPFAFVSGWLTWFGHLVAGAVGALGFGHYVAWGLAGQRWLGPFGRDAAAILLALVVTSVFVAFGYVGARRRRRGYGAVGFAKLGILAVLVAFGLLAILRAPPGDPGPFFADGTTGVLGAMVLTFVAFQGYEVIAQAGEEVRNPRRTIPRAMFLSLGVVVVLYVAVAFVAIWAVVPASPPTPAWLEGLGPIAIVAVGEQIVPFLGGPLLAAGGLIATLAALNTTLFSASRLSFAMGRDRVLPKALGRVHPQFRAPSTAILLSGIVILFLVLLQDLRVVATTASLVFLLAFTLVNGALVRWRVKHPEVRQGFSTPLFPAIPAFGIAANLVLLVFLATRPSVGQLPWTIAVLWLGVGLLLYYPYRGREEIARALPRRVDLAQLLAAEAAPVELARYRVLLPLREFRNVGLVRLGAGLAAARRGELSLMNVLEIPRSLPPKAIRFHYVDDRIKALRKVERYARQFGVDPRATVRVGHLPYEIVLDAIEEEHANMLVLGWRGDRPVGEVRILGSTIDYLVQRAPCDVVVARTRGLKDEVRKILLVPGSPDHARGAAALAAVLAQGDRAAITLLEVPPEGWSGPTVGDALVAELRKANVTARVRRPAATSVADAAVSESAAYDLLVLGAGARWGLLRSAFGAEVDRIAASAKCPVVMYRKGVPAASTASTST